MTKICKILHLKIVLCFWPKLQSTHPQASIRDAQATEEAVSPQKRTSSTSKHEFSFHFSIFVGHFCPPSSGSGLRIQQLKLIRIRNWNLEFHEPNVNCNCTMSEYFQPSVLTFIFTFQFVSSWVGEDEPVQQSVQQPRNRQSSFTHHPPKHTQ